MLIHLLRIKRPIWPRLGFLIQIKRDMPTGSPTKFFGSNEIIHTIEHHHWGAIRIEDFPTTYCHLGHVFIAKFSDSVNCHITPH